MCKIIQFKPKESNGYKNLSALFEICDSVESCNFYLESAEHLHDSGNISDNELYTLRRIGRQKRIELATPAKEAVNAEKPGTYLYTPEMGEEKPQGCQMEASLGYYGKHYYVDSSVELKGRGITFIKQYKPGDFMDPNDHRNGWYEYRVTRNAFEKLEKQYAIARKCYLD